MLYTIRSGDKQQPLTDLKSKQKNIMSLPTDTKGKAAGAGYFKAEQGQTEILIVGPVVTGYQYWKADGAERSPEVFEEPLEGVRMRDKKDKDGNVVGQEPEKQQFYWALPLYNFKTGVYELAQFTQKGIRDELLALQNNDKWGDPTGNYTITIDKSGEGFKTEYKLMPNPNNDESKALIAEIMKAYAVSPIDVHEVLFGASAPAEEQTEPAAETPVAAEPSAAPAPATEGAPETQS
jgi:hypothetical protein